MINISVWNIVFTVANLLILFVAFRFFFFKPIKGIIEKRQAEADAEFAKAAEKEQKAEAAIQEYEEKLLSTETEKKQIISTARKTADGEYQKIIAEAKQEAKAIKDDAIASAVNEKNEIIDSTKKEIAQLIVDATTKVVGTKTGADVDSELLEQFLSRAGEQK